MSLPYPVKNLRKLISAMPAISSKGAERFLAWWWQNDKKSDFGDAWQEFSKLKPCKKCFFFAKLDLCDFCLDEERDQKKICVVSSVFDVDLIERETNYRGLYFDLGGEITGSRDFKRIEMVKARIDFLKVRLKKENIEELILANDFDSKGEATALFLKENLKEYCGKITRLGKGFGSGDLITYSDPTTLRKAFENRS